MRKLVAILFLLVLISALIQPWMNVSAHPEGESEEEIIKKILEDTAKDLGWPTTVDGEGCTKRIAWIGYTDEGELREDEIVVVFYETSSEAVDSWRARMEDWEESLCTPEHEGLTLEETSFHGCSAYIIKCTYEGASGESVEQYERICWVCGKYVFLIIQLWVSGPSTDVVSWAEVVWEKVQAYGLLEDTEPPEISKISLSAKSPLYEDYTEMTEFVLGWGFKVSALVTDNCGVEQVEAWIAPWDNPSPNDFSVRTQLVYLSGPDIDECWSGTATLPSSYKELKPGDNYALYVRARDLGKNWKTVYFNKKITIEALSVAKIEYKEGAVNIKRAHWIKQKTEFQKKLQKSLLYQGDKVTLGDEKCVEVSKIKINWYHQKVKGVAKFEPGGGALSENFTIGATPEASGWPSTLKDVLFTGGPLILKISWFLWKRSPITVFTTVVLHTKKEGQLTFIYLKSKVAIEPQADGTIRILALEGSPEVSCDYGGSKITLNPGETAVIDENGVPSEPVTFNPETIDKWWEAEFEVPALAEYVMGKGEGESLRPTEETKAFSTSDEEAKLWLNFTNVHRSHEVTAEWYDPDDKFHASTTCTIEQPPLGNYWENYHVLLYMPIKNEEAAGKPGTWNVKVYLDDEPLLSTTFEIKSPTDTSSTLLGLTLLAILIGTPLYLLKRWKSKKRKKNRRNTRTKKKRGQAHQSRGEKVTSEADLELARIIGKAEAGKPLSAKEELMLLPYAILEDIDKMYEEFKRDGKIKPRRRHTPNL